MTLSCIITVDCEELSVNVRNWRQHIEADALSSVCHPLPRAEAETVSVDLYQPTMCNIVSDELLGIIPDLAQLNNSMLFKEIWIKEAQKIIHRSALEPAVLLTWSQASKSWKDFCQKLTAGTQTFKAVQKHVKVLNGDFKKIEEEFKLIDKACEASPDKWVKKRIYQLQTYKKIQSCQNAAKLILEVKEVYCLEGEFGPVIRIKELVSIYVIDMYTCTWNMMYSILHLFDNSFPQDILHIIYITGYFACLQSYSF